MTVVVILEALVLASSLSLDAFVAGFGYGSGKIKIPMLSVQIINVICSSILGLSLLAGSVIRPWLPPGLTTAVCFTILLVLGIVKLLDSVTKSIIRKYSNLNKELRFSLFNFKFILHLYANPEEADVDDSRTISPSEAVSLAVSLSLDGLGVGFGAALGDVNGWAVVICSLVTGVLAILLGCFLGGKVARKIPFNLSWLSGVILIVLAVMKLL